MRAIDTAITIEATPEQVWDVLTDFGRHGDWNPFMRRIVGRPEVGQRLEVQISPPGGKPSAFRPTVTAVEPGRRLEWIGRLGVRGLFDGKHSFELSSADGVTTRFEHSERFSGLLVPIVWRSMVDPTTAGFEQFNEAIARRTTELAAAR